MPKFFGDPFSGDIVPEGDFKDASKRWEKEEKSRAEFKRRHFSGGDPEYSDHSPDKRYDYSEEAKIAAKIKEKLKANTVPPPAKMSEEERWYFENSDQFKSKQHQYATTVDAGGKTATELMEEIEKQSKNLHYNFDYDNNATRNYENPSRHDDKADAISYFMHSGKTDKEMVEFYRKFKNVLPPDIWTNIQKNKLRVVTDYDNLTCNHHIALFDQNEQLVERFAVSQLEIDSTENESMSNKFLPFVVESSTPLHIFKTLMSRSKGMNNVTVASIFNLTLNEDINKLRKFVKDLPEMPLEKAYDELLTKHEKYRIEDELLLYFQSLVDYADFSEDAFEDHVKDKKLFEFSDKDMMMFFCVLSFDGEKLSEYTDINFTEMHNYETIFESIPTFIDLSDEGEEMRFNSAFQVAAFILFSALIYPKLFDEPRPTYKLVIKSPSEAYNEAL